MRRTIATWTASLLGIIIGVSFLYSSWADVFIGKPYMSAIAAVSTFTSLFLAVYLVLQFFGETVMPKMKAFIYSDME